MPSVTTSTAPLTATMQPWRAARARAIGAAASEGWLLSTPRVRSPPKLARAMISEAFPRITVGPSAIRSLHSYSESGRGGGGMGIAAASCVG